MKNVYKIDMVVILVSVFVLMILVGYTSPLVIAPLDEYETNENSILFVIENADKLLIDDNIDFTTPEEYVIGEGLKINLKPGKYYWKAVGVFKSEIKSFTINSEVVLELKEIEEGRYGVVNSGNTRLNVDVYNGTFVVDKMTLKVGDEVEVSGDKIVGGWDVPVR